MSILNCNFLLQFITLLFFQRSKNISGVSISEVTSLWKPESGLDVKSCQMIFFFADGMRKLFYHWRLFVECNGYQISFFNSLSHFTWLVNPLKPV